MDQKKLRVYAQDLYEYMKEMIGFEKDIAGFNFVSDEKNAQNPLGKTGGYSPETGRIIVYIAGRHPKDILRSIAHEIVHHSQNCKGMFKQEDVVSLQNIKYAQENEFLRRMEREAYELGNILFRDWETEKRTNGVLKESVELLNEGGVAGHMSHLYDNLELTFTQMKDIFVKAASGKLVGTEKTDGQNLFLSYSVKDGKAKAARNKGNIKAGGMSPEELAQKFAGRGSLEEAFTDAFHAWEKMVKSLPKGVQLKLFGSDADIYYNAEIQDPRTSNVIRYDTKNLVIHQKGHAWFDKETGRVTDKDISENWKLLNSILEKNKIKKHDYNVLNNALVNLKSLSDKKPLQDAVSRLETVLNEAGISDNQTIEDFILVRVNALLDEYFVKFPDETRVELVRRILGFKGVTLNSIFATLPKNEDIKAQKEKIRAIVKKSSIILKNAIQPIEDIVHDFSVAMLKGLQSAFVLDQGDEVQRLRKELDTAIRTIEKSGDKEALGFLQRQMNKIKNLENISTAAEGFVFDYGGKVYKFTGNFAPMNQILGLFKYGRGVKSSGELDEKKENENRTVAILPGGFKPPHAGHFEAAKWLQQKTRAAETIVFVSPKSRTGEAAGKAATITARKSLEVWNMYLKNEQSIWADVAPDASPVRAVYDYMETMSPGDTLYLGLSDKDKNDNRFAKAQQWSDKNQLGVKVEVVVIPIKTSISGTQMRELIASGLYGNFAKYLPSSLSNREKKVVWGIVRSENLDEISAMAGGAVEGGGIAAKKKSPTLFREIKEFIKTPRGEFYMQLHEEMEFRKLVRKLIHKRLDRKTIEEQQLRQTIRKMIVQEAASEETTHFSTGINVLKTLLKKIVPIIESGYKQLTTSKEQRDSFRAHIVSGVEKTLDREEQNISASPGDSSVESDSASVEPELSIDEPSTELEEAPINVDVGDVPDKSKFIDIDGDGKPDDEEKSTEPGTTEEEFAIEGHDETGRKMAFDTYQKIEKDISNTFTILSYKEDRDIFHEYLITNIKLHMDSFEKEISSNIQEPTTPSYEKEKSATDIEDETGLG